VQSPGYHLTPQLHLHNDCPDPLMVQKVPPALSQPGEASPHVNQVL